MKSFSTLHHACAHSLDELETATRQTLNLLTLVDKFPANVEHQTALDMQRARERKARAAFLRRERGLLRLVAEEEGFEPPNEFPR
jgi:hypothetical protein